MNTVTVPDWFVPEVRELLELCATRPERMTLPQRERFKAIQRRFTYWLEAHFAPEVPELLPPEVPELPPLPTPPELLDLDALPMLPADLGDDVGELLRAIKARTGGSS